MNFLKSVDAQYLEDPGKTLVDLEGLFENGHKQVGAHGDPDLCLDGVVAGAEEGLDAQVLLDPFEEQLDLPSALVNACHSQCWQGEVVREKDQILAGFGIEEADLSQWGGVFELGAPSAQTDGLVAAKTGRLGHLARLRDVVVKVALGSNNKESSCPTEAKESFEIEVCAVHHINRSGNDRHLVEEPHVVNLSLCNIDKQWDGALKVHLGVNLYRRFGRAKTSPGKKSQAKIDGGRIDSHNHPVQSKGVGLVSVKPTGLADEQLGESLVNAPVPVLVRISQIRSSDPATETHGVGMLIAPQAGFDVPKTLPIGHLSEDHRKELISCGHASALSGHRVQRRAVIELLAVNVVGDLGENQTAGVHPLLRMNRADYGQPVQMRHTSFSSLVA